MKHAGKHRSTKQLRIKDLMIRERRGISVTTRANVADTMTKPLPAEAYRRHRYTLGVREIGGGETSVEEKPM
ncbi:hypothetical protein PHMEG_0001034 [Phytophthora megakarya]|uniref:Uncharacterized protein n=1 Tax=Phytophthora megakarya TaxID=4795 RepID=A0A225X1I4_9STRA|nr:hypothetical protein PHMEG_0001034 [Phytophthora megakarya]